MALVLKYAVACRIVLPRRFEEVPLFIPEPDGTTGGHCYRGGARTLEPHVLEWILNMSGALSKKVVGKVRKGELI